MNENEMSYEKLGFTDQDFKEDLAALNDFLDECENQTPLGNNPRIQEIIERLAILNSKLILIEDSLMVSEKAILIDEIEHLEEELKSYDK